MKKHIVRTASVLILCLCMVCSILSGCSDNVAIIVDAVEYDIVINEVMSSNSRYAKSSDGLYYDWIELYNGSDHDINMYGCYLSDNELTPMRWQFPEMVIGSGEYAIIYLSGNAESPEGEFHANFKLSSEGENLILSDTRGALITQLTIPASEENVSYGLDSAGSGSYVWYATPTPLAQNFGSSASDFEKLEFARSNVVINEYMTNNSYIIYDSDSDYSDWVELYNPSGAPANLTGYSLSDDPASPDKWIFPQGTTIEPKSYLLVWCSGKDKVSENGEIHTSFALGQYDTSIGLYSPRGDAESVAAINALNENVSCGRADDGSYMLFASPTPGKENTTASFLLTSAVTANLSDGIYISETLSVSGSSGKYTNDYIEIHNSTSQPVSLLGYGLSKQFGEVQFTFPDVTIQAGGYLVVYCTGTERALANATLSTAFKLNQGGDTLYLTDSTGRVRDVYATGKQVSGVSSGRISDDVSTRVFFSAPTPGKVNNSDKSYAGFAAAPSFSQAGGYTKKGTKIAINVPEGTTVYYTTNGSKPSSSSKKYTGELTINKSTVVRAIAYQDGMLASSVVTATYLVVKEHDIPVVCLSSDHDGLFSYRNGMMVDGPGYTEDLPHYGSNYWKGWEREAHFEYYVEDGSLALEWNAGIRCFGQYARGLPQKGLAIILRESYGANEITYPFFEDNPVSSYKSLLLRPSGQDWNRAKLRDELVPALIKGQMDVDYMDYKAVALYINGQYWGLYYLREKLNENYISYKYGYEKGNIDLIKGQWITQAGSMTAYNNLIKYMRNNDMTTDKAYDYFCSQVDVESLVNFWIVQTFVANADSGNIRFFRSRDDGKWRWMLYDFDWAFRTAAVNYNYIDRHMLDPEGHGAVNNMSNLMTRRLLRNSDFKRYFATEYCKHLKTTFSYERTSEILDEMMATIESEIPRQYERWGAPSVASWKKQCSYVDSFLKRRPAIVKEQVRTTLGYSRSTFNKIWEEA